MKVEFKQFINPGCRLQGTTLYAVFRELWERTGGYPCNGCYWEETCSHKKNLTKTKEEESSIYEESNASMAARLGISKRQASKLRKEGENE